MKNNNKEAEKLKKLFFTQLDQIYTTCETGAKEFNANHIPLSYLKICIDMTKKGFDKGFKAK